VTTTDQDYSPETAVEVIGAGATLVPRPDGGHGVVCRVPLVGGLGGEAFVDDAKNTDPDALGWRVDANGEAWVAADEAALLEAVAEARRRSIPTFPLKRS
jgi:hypothetical protein